jgi:hypothetical protein
MSVTHSYRRPGPGELARRVGFIAGSNGLKDQRHHRFVEFSSGPHHLRRLLSAANSSSNAIQNSCQAPATVGIVRTLTNQREIPVQKLAGNNSTWIGKIDLVS